MKRGDSNVYLANFQILLILLFLIRLRDSIKVRLQDSPARVTGNRRTVYNGGKKNGNIVFGRIGKENSLSKHYTDSQSNNTIMYPFTFRPLPLLPTVVDYPACSPPRLVKYCYLLEIKPDGYKGT